MGKKVCENCEQIIGNLEESFLNKNHVVCNTCKILLENESQAIRTTDNKAETEIPIAEILPYVADTKHDATVIPIPQYEQEKNYGGIRRTGYFFGMLGLAVINVILETTAQTEPSISTPGWIVTVTVAFVLVVNRLHNIGKSGWLSVLIFVPIANLYVGITCLMCPEGYQDTKKLDTAGKNIAGILIGLVVLVILSIIIPVIGC